MTAGRLLIMTSIYFLLVMRDGMSFMMGNRYLLKPLISGVAINQPAGCLFSQAIAAVSVDERCFIRVYAL